MIFYIAIIMGIIAARSYNKLQRLGQGIKSANATVLTVIQKRADLVNRLMDIAKDYGAHEKLVSITLSNNLIDTFKASTEAIANVNSMAQHFPDLKANVAYQQLMNEISLVENELQNKRESYNKVTQDYNSERLQIPTVLFSKVLGFEEAPYFDFNNFQEMKEFKTDDGQLLKEMLSNVSSKAMDITQKGVDKLQSKTEEEHSSIIILKDETRN
ncbi:MAG: LemA family protein [Pelosinus sp.]|jgi:LemA protein|nr:LemA family protein [Pelosinus sp.]